MLFNSFEFLLFLPIVFILYWFVFKSWRWQNVLVVVTSYVFYGWWDWRFLILIAITTVCSFLSGLWIERFRLTPWKARMVSAANILLNLGILCVFKYYDFFAANLATFLGIHPSQVVLNLILPVGISFYTFQALSYSIDVYRQKLPATHDLVAFAAYISFFPQLVAGPIERATHLLPQFLRSRKFDYSCAADGMRQILWGLFKKLIIADHCATFVDYVFSQYHAVDMGGITMFLGGVAFAFQIYGDFSGYSDMAIGIAKLFNISLRKNFDVPYFSRDIAEFWRRWHISLNSWFVDYLYIPLGGSRQGRWKTLRNTMIVFLVSGLWHGANWTFIAWGAYHACLFVPLTLLHKNRRYLDVVAPNAVLPTAKESMQMIVTFCCVVFGWMIFRAESIDHLCDYVWQMIRNMGHYYPLGTYAIDFVYIALLLVVEWFTRKSPHPLSYVPIPWRVVRIFLYALFFIWMIVHRGNQATFIYFQF